MLSVHLICVGKLKEKFYLAACAEYQKRLGAYCKLELTELSEERLPQNPSRAQIDAALEREAAAIRGKIPQNACLVALCVEGRPHSSEELARNICTNPARVRKVLARMKKDGLVETKEGSSGGGYRFAKGAGEVSLAQVARALEVRFVSTSWHSGSQEVKCLVATGMAQVMDALFDDLDGRCMARLEEITVEQVDRKLSGGPCPGGG